MSEPRRHTLHLSDHDVAVIERSLRTRHEVLTLTGDMRSTEEVRNEADRLAKVAAVVQGHMRKCECAEPASVADVPEPLSTNITKL